eukprot:509230_1
MSFLLLLFLFASSCSALLTSPSLWRRNGGDIFSSAGRSSPSLAGSTTNISPITSVGGTYATDASLRQGLRFLTPEVAEEVRRMVGTPTYVYDLQTIKTNAKESLAFPNSFGLTVRFAMKALPTAAILRIFTKMNLHFDASSGYEVKRAIHAGVPADRISLSTQELPSDFCELSKKGISINCCSLNQLDRFGKCCPGETVGVRFNPGLGSGGTGKTNVGGPDSSFGIWHEQADRVREIAKEHGLTISRIHTHIGSGSDPDVWQKVSRMSLELCKAFPYVKTLNLGGGYKVGRMPGEASTDLDVIGKPVKEAFEQFAADTGRKLHLEIEPGTFLVANAGSLVATVQDKVSTGLNGRQFLKLDMGMTDLLRPSLYGAQHPIVVIPQGNAESRRDHENVVVVGHCCESGDLLTPVDGIPDAISERRLIKSEVGDLCVIEGCGAYSSSMSTKNYNSFPESPELLIDEDGKLHIIRKRESVEQIWQNEVDIPTGII